MKLLPVSSWLWVYFCRSFLSLVFPDREDSIAFVEELVCWW